LRSIIRTASIDCAEIFARNLECGAKAECDCRSLPLTLRNRERYKDLSRVPLGALPDTDGIPARKKPIALPAYPISSRFQ